MTPKLLPLALQEIASHGFTHMFRVTADQLTQVGFGATQDILCPGIKTGDYVTKAEMRVQVPFQNTLDKGFNSLTASLGDSFGAASFLAAKELNANNGRTYNDLVLNSTATVTSATANFTTADVGKRITGPGIPDNTYIGVRNNATSIGLSSDPAINTPVAATATASGVTGTIYGRTSPAASGKNALTVSSTGPYLADNSFVVHFSPMAGKALVNVNAGELHIYVQMTNPKHLSDAAGTTPITK